MLKALALIAVLLNAGPSDEMFEDLKSAPTPEEAESVASDIWASWMESGSATIDLLMERAVSAEQGGDTGHARALYDRVILIKPDYAEAWHRRAALFYSDNQLDEALRDLNETLVLEPRHFGAWFALATLLERLGAEEEARDAYREVLALHPQWDAARSAAARLDKAILGTAL
ncbi:MAG: tetratricopeptide repeat protein [Pseudomonadota bacterium]